MKEYLQDLVRQSRTAAEASLVLREYLQARILEALQQAGAFQNWAFLGGTALRFLYRLPRFSEDLVFSRVGAAQTRDVLSEEFAQLIGNVQRTFSAEAYVVETRNRPEAVVQSSFIAFPDLMYELGLSPHRDRKISIKVEVDTNPLPHVVTEKTIVRRHVLLNLLHYDKSSMLAGKLHALIQRPYVKGHDVYDLIWYLSDPAWPEPNLALLRASLEQTGMEETARSVEDWRRLVADRINVMDWDRVTADVSPFLESSREIAMLTRENVLSLLKP